MRNIASRFAIITIILLAVGNISMNGVKGRVYTPPGTLTLVGNDVNGSQDTVPPPPKLPKEIKAPKFELPKKAPNLLKLLGNIFKFKQHSNENEKRRVVDIINKMGLTDSIAASEQNVKFLIYKLTDTINQNIDSLRAMINFIRNNEQDLYSMQQDIASVQNDLDTKFDTLSNFIRISKDRYAANDVSEKDLNILANKMFPVLSENIELNLLTRKMDTITMLEKIRASAWVVHTDTATGRTYHIKTKNRIDVYGFYDMFKGTDIESSKLGYLNTLIYNSLVINSRTGDIHKNFLAAWYYSPVINYAIQSGCTTAVSFVMDDSKSLYNFLSNEQARTYFINSAVKILKYRDAKAINIAFGNFSANETAIFGNFIEDLYKSLKKVDTAYKLLITVPAISGGGNYPIGKLKDQNGRDTYDRIIIDFSKNYASKASPLASLTAMPKVVLSFINFKVPPEKLVVCLPYRGTKWAINNGTGYADKFIEYIPYDTLRMNFMFPRYTYYAVDSNATAVMDSAGKNLVPVRRIFYDDQSTISKKYEKIRSMGIGGVAVNGLGDDNGYSELWDEMSFAFAVPDTIYSKAAPASIVKDDSLNFFQKLTRYFTLYNYVLQHPCEKCFGNITDTVENKIIHEYLEDLNIGQKMEEENNVRIGKYQNTFRSHYEYINHLLKKDLLKITLILFIILLLLLYYYGYKVRKLAEKWATNKKNRMKLLCFVVFILFFLSGFSLLFSSDYFPLFGVTRSNSPGYSNDFTNYRASTGTDESIINLDYCAPEKGSKCINMPLNTLLLIILAVFGISLFIYWLTKKFGFSISKTGDP